MHLGHFFIKSNTLLIMAILTISPAGCADKLLRRRARTCLKVEIPNAELSYRSRFKIMRVNCQPGYELYGSNTVLCEMGKWNAALPVCAKRGCKDIDSPPNGDINYSKNQQAHLYCRAGYKLAGGRVTYCNGTSWDRPLGSCRESTEKVQLSCDFETEDLCGWSHDETHDFDWKRIMAGNVFSKLRTGPQHDHTTLTANSGHYMLMESFDQVFASVARLVSPIFSKNITENTACFKFHYFMYGATVGNLSVYVKPISINSDNLLQTSNNQIKSTYRHFLKSGNQKNVWNEAQFTIEEMSEDFQIIIEGTTGTNHLSDIAIDDVQLMKYSECNGEQLFSTTAQSDVTEYAIYDVQSCEGRCGETNITHYGLIKMSGRIYKNCDCHNECEDLKTCCPNYHTVCEIGAPESSTEVSDLGTTLNSVKKTSTTISAVGTKPMTARTSIHTTTSTTVASNSSTKTTMAIIKTITITTTATPKTSPKTAATGASINLSTLLTSTTLRALATNQQHASTSSTTTAATSVKIPTDELTPPAGTKESSFSVATKKLPNSIEAPLSVGEKTRIQPEVRSVDSVPAQRTGRIISWEVVNKSQPTNKSPSWLIFMSTMIGVAIIAATGVVLRFHKACRRRVHIYKRGSRNNDTTTLLYSQSDELIVVS